MLRRPLLLLLSAALVFAPTTAAVAEEATESSDTAEVVGPETAPAPAPSLTALADLVDAIAAALGVEGAGGVEADGATLTDDQRAAFRLLLDQVLEGIKVDTLIATAAATDDADDAETSDTAEDVTGEDDDTEADGGVHGEVVSTVARCAPRGHGMRGLFESVRNHGALVRVAARGGSVTLTVPVLSGEGTDVTVGSETEEVTHELTGVAAAEALCADLETIAAAAALSASLADEAAGDVDERAERAEARDAEKAERAEARDARKAERAEARDARKAERAEARDAEKAERAEAREARKAERAGGRASGGDDESDPTTEDPAAGGTEDTSDEG